MFVIPGGLAERLGFKDFSINLDTADLADVREEDAAVVITNPRMARKPE
ncbi:MAG: hypothetical protein UT41_C0001G0454 [Candidatus Wolfebacteria bacterium GW2011_GWC2_39_22]|uniref:Uncharacterized protein n=1 Tax=Candidatus Wolfebacteria bacterium GW2011_GWC2_39_22 TaxID=1619013 RepID=A0A0G0QR94_9BACT|nr:MAG: hypothetical protein UT41_C0001G0454 [Candidatus Wolfebacteria bacterium GW2011_GWC2_39_22]